MLKKAEQVYETANREYLAVAWAVLLLGPCFERSEFTFRTDHDALWGILNMADGTENMGRWRLRLSKFDIELVHRAVVKHQADNAESRLAWTGMDKSPLKGDRTVLMITKAQSKAEKTKTNAEVWPSLHSNDGLDPVKPALPEVLQILDENDKE